MVAGEASGDYLAAGLIEALRRQAPDIEVEGIGGPLMSGAGATLIHPMDTISIMGVDGLAKNLRAILAIRRSLYQRWTRRPPDVFVGVDVPDFNLGLERRLHRAAIPTLHYVSPTLWAWRAYRIRKLRAAVDEVLTLFPFEADYLRQRGVPATFVGHPLADEVPERIDRAAARAALGVASPACVVALLPGSRHSELARLGGLFVEVARRLHADRPGELCFLAPFISEATRAQFARLLRERAPELPVRLFAPGGARQVLAASDVALLASGTAALEAALHQVPMVVCYRVSGFTSVLVRLFVRVRHFSMPNHLLEHPVVPELMQGQATAERVTAAMQGYLDDPDWRRDTAQTLARIPRLLRRGANQRAARAVLARARRGAAEHGG